MPLDFALAQPAVAANPMAAYSQGLATSQAQFEAATARQVALDTRNILKDYASEQRVDTGKVISPLQRAEAAERTSSKLLAAGNFQAATSMLNQAKELREQGKEAFNEGQKKQLAKFETAAKLAQGALANPGDPEAARSAVTAYLAAGGDASILGKLETHEDAQRALREISYAALDSTKRIDLEQKEYEKERDRRARADLQKQKDSDNLYRSQMLAALRGGGTPGQTGLLGPEDITRIATDVIGGEDMPKNLSKGDVAKVQEEITKQRKAGAVQEHFAKGVYAQSYAQRQTQSGQILLTEIANMSDMKIGQTAGVFSDVALGKGITDSLHKYFGNTVTSTQAAEYNASSAGLGVEIATLLSSGRQPQKYLIEDFQSILRANPGDTVETTLYKRAMVVNLARNALAVAPSANATDKQNKQRILEQLRGFPTPAQVRAEAEKYGHTIQGEDAINAKMKDVSEKWKGSIAGEEEHPVVAANKGVVAPYSDPEKEARYQEWKRQHGQQ